MNPLQPPPLNANFTNIFDEWLENVDWYEVSKAILTAYENRTGKAIGIPFPTTNELLDHIRMLSLSDKEVFGG